MTKRKIIIICLTVTLVLLLGIGIYIGVRIWQGNTYTYTVNDTLPEGNGQKATVILLGGQSNASGCSLDEYLKKNVSSERYAQYQNGFDNVYINYISGANTSGGFVKCSTLQGELEGAFGPELGMAEKLNALYPDQLFFIVKCAWGGTNLFEQWLSPTSKGKTGDLYKRFEAFVDANMNYLTSKGYDAEIAGMCWMQGESDSFSVENATDYKTHLSNFIQDIRKKFAPYGADGGIAFVDAYIADNPNYWVYCEYVNQSKLAVANASPLNVVIDTVTMGLSCSAEPEGNPDMAHYDSLSQIQLGHAFIEELAKFLD